MSDQWETFCDVSYYHMWRLRRETERGWNDGFHINTRDEAQALCQLLNKLERELTAVTEQRDRLAEELKEAQNAIEMMLRDSSCRRIPAYTEEQLAAVKGGKDD
jgi:hypothetical protein